MRVTSLPDNRIAASGSNHPGSPHSHSRSRSYAPDHENADLPFSFLREERRLAGLALQSWRRHQRAAVPGFEATSLSVADPGGTAMVLHVAPALEATFALAVGQSLAQSAKAPANRIAAELCAACDLVALGGRPIPFEASLTLPDLGASSGGLVLVRGIVLPLIGARYDIETVQIVLSWREVLNRSATRRLRRELGDVLRNMSGGTEGLAEASDSSKSSARPRQDPFPTTAPPSGRMRVKDH
jgi:hypothetical protein